MPVRIAQAGREHARGAGRGSISRIAARLLFLVQPVLRDVAVRADGHVQLRAVAARDQVLRPVVIERVRPAGRRPSAGRVDLVSPVGSGSARPRRCSRRRKSSPTSAMPNGEFRSLEERLAISASPSPSASRSSVMRFGARRRRRPPSSSTCSMIQPLMPLPSSGAPARWSPRRARRHSAAHTASADDRDRRERLDDEARRPREAHRRSTSRSRARYRRWESARGSVPGAGCAHPFGQRRAAPTPHRRKHHRVAQPYRDPARALEAPPVHVDPARAVPAAPPAAAVSATPLQRLHAASVGSPLRPEWRVGMCLATNNAPRSWESCRCSPFQPIRCRPSTCRAPRARASAGSSTSCSTPSAARWSTRSSRSAAS